MKSHFSEKFLDKIFTGRMLDVEFDEKWNEKISIPQPVYFERDIFEVLETLN